MSESWRVYNLTGVLVYHGIAVSETAKIALPGRGIFIVTNNRNAVKVAY